MGEDMIGKMKEHFAKLAVKPPRLSILSDNPLPEDELFEESFNLSYRVGPAFEIIRHEDMETPLTIAIYGRWGAGKTTAMRWLEKMLEDRFGKPEEAIRDFVSTSAVKWRRRIMRRLKTPFRNIFRVLRRQNSAAPAWP